MLHHASTCFLSHLHEEKGGCLPGIIIEGPELRIKQDLFSCCDGSGSRFNEVSNGVPQGSVSRCDLVRRLASLRRLVGLFRKRWPFVSNQMNNPGKAVELFSINRSIEQTIQKRLSRYNEGSSSKKGFFIIESEKEHLKPSILWGAALRAVWFFGYDAHVLKFGQDNSSAKTNFFKEADSRTGRPIVCFLEKVEKLWDPGSAFDLEALISYCYDRCIPLWIEFIVNDSGDSSETPPPLANRFSKPISRRIANLKAKSPLEWLSKQARLKLETISDDLNGTQNRR